MILTNTAFLAFIDFTYAGKPSEINEGHKNEYVKIIIQKIFVTF